VDAEKSMAEPDSSTWFRTSKFFFRPETELEGKFGSTTGDSGRYVLGFNVRNHSLLYFSPIGLILFLLVQYLFWLIMETKAFDLNFPVSQDDGIKT
jgi:hypothetical protein